MTLPQGATHPNFFDQGSPFLHHPLLTAERTNHEVDFLVDLLGLAPPMRLLDVGCGFGRHSIALARRGYIVTGIDPSPTMIQAATAPAATDPVTTEAIAVDFSVADGTTFQSDEPFDALLCLFTTLGQHDDHGANTSMLYNLHAMTRPGGAMAIEVPQREIAVAQLLPEDRFEHADGFTLVTRRYDEQDRSISERFEVVTPQGQRVYTLRYQLFSADELTRAVTSAGFQVVDRLAGYTRNHLTDQSPTMLFICRR